MFRITGKKGFHITFENGYKVSVQFGPGNYCENYGREIGKDDEVAGSEGSATAECAVFDTDRRMLKYEDWGGDTVSNRSTPSEVLELLNWAARQKVKIKDSK